MFLLVGNANVFLETEVLRAFGDDAFRVLADCWEASAIVCMRESVILLTAGRLGRGKDAWTIDGTAVVDCRMREI